MPQDIAAIEEDIRKLKKQLNDAIAKLPDSQRGTIKDLLTKLSRNYAQLATNLQVETDWTMN